MTPRSARPRSTRSGQCGEKRPGNIVVPGHDVPMVLENGATKYIDKREAAISAWFGDDMETTTLFKLTL